ncbi:MAG: hypothetical protein WAQ05_15730 [Rubrivivax sp.]
MKIRTVVAGAALALSSQAFAAPPAKAVLLDFSSEALIDAASAKAMLGEGIPAKVWKVYPASKWGFVSQVEGGLTSAGVCVVTARVMMISLTPTVKAPLFRPEKIATTFDAATGASAEQCKALAKSKLSEALQSVVSGLVKG